MEAQSLSDFINKLQKMCSTSCEVNTFNNILNAITALTKVERKELTSKQWKILLHVADISNTIMKKKTQSTEELNFVVNYLRCLRNSCAGCCSDDQSVIRINDLLNVALNTVHPLIQGRQNASDTETVCLRCCLQLFGNIVCQSDTSKDTIWITFNEDDIFKNLLEDKDTKVKEYTLMILYNCLTTAHRRHIVSTDDGRNILVLVINLLQENIVDWGVLFLESVVGDELFMESCYILLPIKNRLFILDLITEQLSNTDNDSCISEGCLKSVVQYFSENALDILKANESCLDDFKPAEIAKLLSLLCAASLVDGYASVLKDSKELLEISLDTLKSMHLLGKKSCNAFSALASLRDSSNLTKEEIEIHPAFGFKKSLIRLIGNLCYQCKDNQDHIHKLDGIPLLLDCCNLDINNPYIMQWCILAIHNIVEDNVENQAALAEISVTGELVKSPLLHELGLDVEYKDGQHVLKKFKVS